MKHALILSLGLACAAITSPATAHDALGQAIERHTPKSWFTPAQKAYIDSKCGIDTDRNRRNLNIDGSVMTCPNGRVIDDPQVKAISDDVSRRANDFARTVLQQADVRRAMALATSDATRRAIADADIDATVARALARAERARAAGERARAAAERARLNAVR